MTAQELSSLLVQHGKFEKEGDTLRVPSGSELSLFVAVGAEPLIIDRVSQLQLDQTVLIATTGRQERYLVSYADVRAVRLSRSGSGPGYER
jgi:hypothetical protein